MRRPMRWMAVLIAGAATPATAVQEEIVTGSYIRTCSNTAGVADYGPVERFDGIYFSFVDGARFTSCANRRVCERNPSIASLDVMMLPGSAWDETTQDAYSGWGWYRLSFVGRKGRWRPPHPCIGQTEEFVEVRRVLRMERID